jgi:hypothetical protein
LRISWFTVGTVESLSVVSTQRKAGTDRGPSRTSHNGSNRDRPASARFGPGGGRMQSQLPSAISLAMAPLESGSSDGCGSARTPLCAGLRHSRGRHPGRSFSTRAHGWRSKLPSAPQRPPSPSRRPARGLPPLARPTGTVNSPQSGVDSVENGPGGPGPAAQLPPGKCRKLTKRGLVGRRRFFRKERTNSPRLPRWPSGSRSGSGGRSERSGAGLGPAPLRKPLRCGSSGRSQSGRPGFATANRRRPECRPRASRPLLPPPALHRSSPPACRRSRSRSCRARRRRRRSRSPRAPRAAAPRWRAA